MSCSECSRLQDIAFNKNIDETIPIAYIRVGIANVAIVGCEKHILELIKKYKEGLK